MGNSHNLNGMQTKIDRLEQVAKSVGMIVNLKDTERKPSSINASGNKEVLEIEDQR